MSYWKTLKELNTLLYSLVWIVFVFPFGKIAADGLGAYRDGNYSGALGILTAGLLFLVLIYAVVALFRYGYKAYMAPDKKEPQ